MRDLRRFSEAIDLGLEAEEITPKDFHHCTLLGAVHIERGEYEIGAAWYEEAEALGASRRDVDQEIRTLFARASPEERRKLRSFLLSKDANRFAWAKSLSGNILSRWNRL